MTQTGWLSRGYLPHFDRAGLVQSITFRLADSLPAHLLAEIEDEVEQLKESERDAMRRQRLEAYLDAGYGACHLRDPQIGRLVENALRHFDQERYFLLAWVVMPNHVHTIIETVDGHLLSDVIHSWKSYTAHEVNKILKRRGRFWFHDYFDRYMRDLNHYHSVVKYIHENPVKAGLVTRAEEWPFSSAHHWT